MTSVRTLFRHPYNISSVQRNAASRLWAQLVQMRKINPLQNEMLELLSQKDPEWRKRFTNELDSLIFEHRHEPLTLESNPLPEGVLLEAANNCKIPLAVFPSHVSMTFTDNNNIRVNNEQYTADQIIKSNPTF